MITPPQGGWMYSDCGFEEVDMGWEHAGIGALPGYDPALLPGERCER